MNNTKQRQCVNDVVQNSYNHPTADEVFQIVRQTIPNISLGTVYRNLGVLVEQDKIRKISVPGQADRFDRMADWHDHIVCKKCGKMQDIMLHSPISQFLSEQIGSEIVDYSLMAYYVCPQCKCEES